MAFHRLSADDQAHDYDNTDSPPYAQLYLTMSNGKSSSGERFIIVILYSLSSIR